MKQIHTFTPPFPLSTSQLVEMIVDVCSGNSVDHLPTANTSIPPTTLPPDAHICRGAARLPKGARVLNTGQPLQVGGLAHPLPGHVARGWPESRSMRSFRGCLRNLRINREVNKWSRSYITPILKRSLEKWMKDVAINDGHSRIAERRLTRSSIYQHFAKGIQISLKIRGMCKLFLKQN